MMPAELLGQGYWSVLQLAAVSVLLSVPPPPSHVASLGRMATASVRAVLEPQELSAVTETLPELVPNVTVMEVVPDPEVIEAPVGTVQV
jgi:hypothetical protein